MRFDIQYAAFNIWSVESAKAILFTASELHTPVIIQTSQRVFESIDPDSFRACITDIIKRTGAEAYLHLDHCRDIEIIKRAVDTGWDSVMIDASSMPLAENIKLTNQAVSYAHSRGVPVESEVGAIRGVEDDIYFSGSGIANTEDVKRMLDSTSVDMLAVAVGTAHGAYTEPPNIDFDLIDELQSFMHVPLIIHGGSGLPDDTITGLLHYSIVKKINFSTDVKLAFRQGICKAAELPLSGYDPYTAESLVYDRIKEMARCKLALLKREDTADI